MANFDLEKQFVQLLYSIAAGIIVTGVVYLIQLLVGSPLTIYQYIIIAITVFIFTFFIIKYFKYKIIQYIENKIRPGVKDEVINDLLPQLKKEAHQDLLNSFNEKIGLVNIYNNFLECEKEILDSIKESKKVKVFLQIGKTVLAGTTNFYDYLEDAIHSESKIKILHASLDSPYLSHAIAQRRGSNYEEWVADIEHAIKKIDILSQKGTGIISARQHKEAYIWRLFIFDKVVYVQPYLYEKKNSQQAPVLQFSKYFKEDEENPNSLYKIFDKYFDTKWEEYRPSLTTINEIMQENGRVAVSAIIKSAQFYIFAIPKRYLLSKEKEIPFHGIGGKVETHEELLEALQREAREELGLELSILDSPKTRYITTGAELNPINLSNKPAPYCIYKRLRQDDVNFYHKEVLWLIGWLAELPVKIDQLKPRKEIGALVILTGDMLRRTLYEYITYKQIKNATDGSRVIISESIKFDFTKRAVPSGLAIIFANEIASRFVKRL